MRYSLAPLFILLSVGLTRAQTGACTEASIQAGSLPTSDDAFAYMPPYGKPVIGKPAIKDANAQSFSDRTNIQRKWLSEHRIVSTHSGEMAYEYGTLHMSSDSRSNPTSGHVEFDAVMLIVYKANGSTCQQVALTMYPLEPDPTASTSSTGASPEEQAIRDAIQKEDSSTLTTSISGRVVMRNL